MDDVILLKDFKNMELSFR